jgi:hypothetical protein
MAPVYQQSQNRKYGNPPRHRHTLVAEDIGV